MDLMSENIDKVSLALLEAQKNMGTAKKDSNNPFFKSKYADINSVLEATLGALNGAGISVWQPTVFVEGRKFVKTIFLHTSGQYLAGLTEIVYAKELDPQQQVAAITYARRGGLQSMANIQAEDDDGNTASGRTSEPKKAFGKGTKFAKKPSEPKDSDKEAAMNPEAMESEGESSEPQTEVKEVDKPVRRSFRRS